MYLALKGIIPPGKWRYDIEKDKTKENGDH